MQLKTRLFHLQSASSFHSHFEQSLARGLHYIGFISDSELSALTSLPSFSAEYSKGNALLIHPHCQHSHPAPVPLCFYWSCTLSGGLYSCNITLVLIITYSSAGKKLTHGDSRDEKNARWEKAVLIKTSLCIYDEKIQGLQGNPELNLYSEN